MSIPAFPSQGLNMIQQNERVNEEGEVFGISGVRVWKQSREGLLCLPDTALSEYGSQLTLQPLNEYGSQLTSQQNEGKLTWKTEWRGSHLIALSNFDPNTKDIIKKKKLYVLDDKV